LQAPISYVGHFIFLASEIKIDKTKLLRVQVQGLMMYTKKIKIKEFL